MELPKLIQEFANVIGLESTLRVVQRHGGRRLWVPSKPNEHLVQLIGDEAAQMLCDQFGGEFLPIPRCVELIRLRRDLDIHAKRQAHTSIAELAGEYKMTERAICMILARKPAVAPENVDGRPRKQLKLFG